MDIWIFILVSLGLIASPGPNVLVVISTSISHGRVRGLQTVIGISLAMAVQLLVAAIGTGYFISVLSKGFTWLKWIGAGYLIYIGINHLISAFKAKPKCNSISAHGSFQRGFWVSLTNPKTILFFGAFLPQFIDNSIAYLPQIMLLSFVFWILAVFVNCTYSFLSSLLASLVSSRYLSKYQNGVSGAIYCVGGSLLAGSKNA